jgi:hypothetical protein
MPRLTLLFALFLTAVTTEAQVYRCDTAEGTIYSQLPCAENAERLPQYDPVVEADSSPSADTSGAETSLPEADAPSAMENFISTLERQRDQQIGSIDANMQTLRDQLDASGEAAPDERTREMLEFELAQLTSDRASIQDQYASLISEAANRADAAESGN